MFLFGSSANKSTRSIRRFEVDGDFASDLVCLPEQSLIREMSGVEYTARIVIPNYIDKVTETYRDQLQHDVEYYHSKLRLPLLFKHFGLSMDFHEPVELHLHGEGMALPDSVKNIISEFGVVILRNVFLDSSVRDMGHRNRFPQLNFHIDRTFEQVSYYSVYTRNPFDPEQQHPRTSSTLFIPPLAAYLQGITEHKSVLISESGLIVNITLFDKDSIKPLINRVIVEHAWNSPKGTGEISIINNCNMLHASYYPNIHNKGYRIGVRYLS